MKIPATICLFLTLPIFAFSQAPKLGISYFQFMDAETNELIKDYSIQLPHEPDYVIVNGHLIQNKEEKGISYAVVHHPSGYTEIAFIANGPKTFVIKSQDYEDTDLVISPEEFYTLSKGPSWTPETIKLKRRK